MHVLFRPEFGRGERRARRRELRTGPAALLAATEHPSAVKGSGGDGESCAAGLYRPRYGLTPRPHGPPTLR